MHQVFRPMEKVLILKRFEMLRQLQLLRTTINRIMADLFRIIHRTVATRDIDAFRKIRTIGSLAIIRNKGDIAADLTHVSHPEIFRRTDFRWLAKNSGDRGKL